LSTLTMSKGVGLTRDDKMVLSHSSATSITSFCFCVDISEKSGHSVKMNVRLQGKEMSLSNNFRQWTNMYKKYIITKFLF
jgi:hypothetical protein